MQLQLNIYGQNIVYQPDSTVSDRTLITNLLEDGAKNDMYPGLSLALYANDSIQ